MSSEQRIHAFMVRSREDACFGVVLGGAMAAMV